MIYVKIPTQWSSPLASFNYGSAEVAKFWQGVWKWQPSRKAFLSCSCFRRYNIKCCFRTSWRIHAKKSHHKFSNDRVSLESRALASFWHQSQACKRCKSAGSLAVLVLVLMKLLFSFKRETSWTLQCTLCLGIPYSKTLIH